MAPTSDTERWIVYPRRNPTASLRLFCFSYAGGGASVFRSWPDALPPQVEVCAVQLPGRENRIRENPLEELSDVLDAVSRNHAPFHGMPFALFGHSLGALLAFELGRRLREQQGPQPVHLFVAGERAPHLPAVLDPIYHLRDEKFIETIQTRYDAIPEEILKNEAMMKFMLRPLRADFTISDKYKYTPDAPFSYPITCFGGDDDREVRYEQLAAWCERTTGPCKVQMLPGGHFFLRSAQPSLLAMLSSELWSYCARR